MDYCLRQARLGREQPEKHAPLDMNWLYSTAGITRVRPEVSLRTAMASIDLRGVDNDKPRVCTNAQREPPQANLFCTAMREGGVNRQARPAHSTFLLSHRHARPANSMFLLSYRQARPAHSMFLFSHRKAQLGP